MNIALKTKPDPTLKDFYDDMERCADLINAVCFNGEQIINEHQIQKESNEESTLFEERDLISSFHSYRDIMIKITDQGYFLFIGIENQQYIDTFIGLREFLYTAFNYNRQYRNYQREYRKRSKLGLKTRKFVLTPVITPIIYFGEDEWKEDHYLRDMMSGIPKVWYPIINDWYTRVIDVKKMDISLFRNKDNRELFEGIVKVYKAKGNVDNLNDMRVSKDVAILIATITGMKDLINIIIEQESEEIDMCKSWELFKENEIRIPLEREIKRVRDEAKIALEKSVKEATKELEKEKNNIIQERNNIIQERNDIIQERNDIIQERNDIIQERNELKQMEIQLKEQAKQEAHDLQVSIIITILINKLGFLSKDIQQHLQQISVDKLDILTKQIPHIENENDILTITH